MTRFFIPQEWADAAIMEDRVEVQGDTMMVRADQKRYKIEEAVRIIAVEGGDVDSAGLVGKVKTQEDVNRMGGEQMGDSMIVHDTPYRVQLGFVATFQGSGNPLSVVFSS